VIESRGVQYSVEGLLNSGPGGYGVILTLRSLSLWEHRLEQLGEQHPCQVAVMLGTTTIHTYY